MAKPANSISKITIAGESTARDIVPHMLTDGTYKVTLPALTADHVVSLDGHTHTKSQITDFPTSMPASDVYAWAKASTKPTYTYSEVGAAAVDHNHNSMYMPFSGGTFTEGVTFRGNRSSMWTTPGIKFSGGSLIGENTNHQLGIRAAGTSVVFRVGSTSCVTIDSSSFHPHSEVGSNTYDLGSTSQRWRKLYIGPSDTYGSSTVPVYWNNGAPAVCDLSSVYAAASHRHNTTTLDIFPLSASQIYRDSSLSDTDGYLGVSTTWADDRYVKKGTYGAVSISTTVPTLTAMLEVSTSTTIPSGNWARTGMFLVPNMQQGSTSVIGLGKAMSTNDMCSIDYYFAASGGTTNRMSFSFYSNDNVLNMLANGNVGIGANVTSPAYKLQVDGTIAPYSSSAYNLGSTSNKWSSVFADRFYGNLVGNADSADYATTAGTANSVAWANVTGKPTIPTNTWRPIKVNGADYLTDTSTSFDIVQGNHITIRKPSAGRIIIDYDGTCLIEGTLITMSDGSTKPIEEIQKGDEIKSYDPSTGENISAYALDLECTGSTNEYKYTIFDDGSEIVTYGNHSLYSKDLGYPKDIEKWQMGDKGINLSGETIEMLDQGIVRYKGTWKKHYVLYSSNNLYFANNILTCHWGSTKYKHLKDFSLDVLLPKTVMDVFEEEEHKYGDKGQWMLSKDYVTELVSIRKRRNTLSKLIEDCKKKLSDTDYVGQKYLEGLISAVEWLKHKADRAGWRKLINDNETELATLENQIAAIKRKYKTPHTQRERFAEYVTMCNSIFNDLTKYYKGEK